MSHIPTDLTTDALKQLAIILRDPLSGLEWQNRIDASKVISELIERREAAEWQPIETAPKDKNILVFRPSMWGGKCHIGVAMWEQDKYARRPKPFWQSVEGWIGKTEDRAHPPTHWMPLPSAPDATA